MNIKFSKLNISTQQKKNVISVLNSGWLTHGKYTKLFEEEFKKFTKAKYALTVSSCTAALHISALCAGFKKGDEVIVPAQSHTATSHAVEYTGAKTIFADVDLYSGNLNLENIRKKITNKTKGVILVHMAGLSCEIKEISKFLQKKNIILIEDCAHSLGTYYKKKHAGNFGFSGCFSFYPTKQITTGEGGMFITNSKKIYDKAKMFKAFGIDKDINNRKKQGEYDVKRLGYNYRMTDFQACMGYFQLKDYRKNLNRRKIIAKKYISYLKDNKKIKFLNFSKECSYFIFQVFCKNRDKIIKKLKEKGIGISIHYNKALPTMTYYKKKYNINLKEFKNAIHYGKTNISLPIYPKLKNSEIEKISKTLIKLSNEF